jgi:hypothetical protein
MPSCGGIHVSAVVRWFQDLEGVLKLSEPSKNGKRTRIELRIPFSLAMRVYRERTRAMVLLMRYAGRRVSDV